MDANQTESAATHGEHTLVMQKIKASEITAAGLSGYLTQVSSKIRARQEPIGVFQVLTHQRMTKSPD